MKCPNCGEDIGVTVAEAGRLGGSQTSQAKRDAAVRNARLRWQRVREAQEQSVRNRIANRIKELEGGKP